MSHPSWVTGCLTLIRTIIEQIRNNSLLLYVQAKTKFTNVEVKLCTGHYHTVEDFAEDLRGRLSELVSVTPESQWVNSLYNSVDEQLATFEKKPGHLMSRITEDDFIKPLKNYLCPICSNLFIEPCLTPCGHHFCKDCITQALQHKPECPIDRRNLMGYTPFRDMAIERKIMNKAIKCPNQRLKKSEDCTWKGAISLLQGHFTTCLLEETLCEWGCRQQIERRALTKHDGECPQRFSNCEHCQTRIHIKHVITHAQSCAMVPITCSNMGCPEKFPRKELFRHQQDCGFHLVDCPFREQGCPYKSIRKAMEDHLRNFMGNHLELLQQENSKLKNQKNSLMDFLELKKKIRLTRINNFETDPVGAFHFPKFHIGEYEFELTLRRSNSQPHLSTSLMTSQRQTKQIHNQTATWPVRLTYMIFIQNQVRGSLFLESEKFNAEFKNSGTVDLKNPFLISLIQNGGLIVKDSLKVGIMIDIVREPGFSSKLPSASVLLQDSPAPFSFGKPEDLPQFSFGLPETSSPRRGVTSRNKPIGFPNTLSSPPLWDQGPLFTFPIPNSQTIPHTTTTTTSVNTNVPRVLRGIPLWPTSQTMGGGQVGGTSNTGAIGPATGSSSFQEGYTGVFL